MLDDLRREADASLSEMEAEEETSELDLGFEPNDGRFLGMTAGQRLVIAIMLLVLTVLLGSFCLLVTEKVVLPGLF